MADPSEKSLDMGMFLEELTGHTSSIHDNRCVNPPYGCGGPATEYRDDLSAREYRISGLCQTCQDAVFGTEDEEVYEDGNEY